MFIQSILTTKKHGVPTFSYVYPTKTPPFIVDFARCFTHFLVGPVPWGPLKSFGSRTRASIGRLIEVEMGNDTSWDSQDVFS